MDARKILVKRLAVSLVIGLLLTACLCAALNEGVYANAVGTPALADNKDMVSGFPYWINIVWNIEFTPLEEGWRVSWEARVPGDYNRDGKVGIADITPIAMHFGEEVADDPYLRVIDGVYDGVIDIVDLTKIAQYYGTKLIGFELLLAEQSSDNWRSVGIVAREDHTVPLVGWPVYEANISVEPDERVLWVRILVQSSDTHLVGLSERLPGET